jgi:alpha-ketoglutarate-dependent taurine dioxygenase
MYTVVYLSKVPANIDYKHFYSQLANNLGKQIDIGEDLQTGNKTAERWVDVRYDECLNFTFQHSNTRQPLHTDAAYSGIQLDINFFFCLQNAPVGGATTFADIELIWKLLEKYEPELFTKIQTYDVDFRKGNDQKKRSRILFQGDNHYKVNWNFFRVAPENDKEVLQLCNDFHLFLENKIVHGGLTMAVSLKIGEALFFHDDKVLHGRNSFYGHRHLVKGGLQF